MSRVLRLKKIGAMPLADKLKWGLFVLLFIVAAFRRFSLPQTPFADHDLNGYLNPALVYFKTGAFVHFNYRSFPYPLFMLVIIGLTHSLKAIAITQHLSGLLTGFIIFKIWDEPCFKDYSNLTIKIVATILQLVSAGYFLLASGIIFFEHTIRPESTSIFFMVLVLYLLIKSLNQALSVIIYLGLALFLTLLTFIYSPRWGFALPVTLVYILGAIICLQASRLKKLGAVILPTLLFLVLVWLPERHLIIQYDPQTDQMALRQFFYDHADVAKEVLSEDCGDGKVHAPFNIQTLRFINSVIIIEPAHDYYFGPMGFNPDSLLYGRPGRVIDSVFWGKPDLAATFFRTYSQKIIMQGYSQYLNRVIKEYELYYWSNPNHERVYLYEPDSLKHLYTLSKASVYADMDSSTLPFKTYKSNVLSMPHYNLVSRFSILNMLYFVLQFSFLPTLILFAMAYFTQSAFLGNLNHANLSSFNLLAKVCWLTFFIHLALVTTVAAIHTFGVARYVESIFPVALLLQAFCVLYLFIFVFYISKKNFPLFN